MTDRGGVLRLWQLSLWFSLAAVLMGVMSVEGRAQAATIFDLGGGVRALGMGEAFVAIADDEQALFYNPAGLAYQERLSLSAFYESHFISSHYLNASAALRRWGVGVSIFSLGGVEERDANDTVKGTFDYASFALMGAYGLALSDIPLAATRAMSALALGVRVKSLLISTIEPGGGFGFGLEPAFLWNITKVNLAGFRTEAIRSGLFFENLISTGTGPLRLRLGTALLFSDVAVGLDIVVPFEFHLGGEVRVRVLPGLGDLAIRMGAIVRQDAFSLTVGLGFALQDFQFDYAFNTHPQLPGSHRLAFSWRL